MTINRKLLLALIAFLVLALIAPTLWGWYSTPNFSNYAAGNERKTAFFEYMLPLVTEQNKVIIAERQSMLSWYEARKDLSWWKQSQTERLAKKYKLSEFDPENEAHWASLKTRVDAVPPSLALAQAANESAWGTSRFAREGNNYYGQWCYTAGCGIVPKSRGKGEKHEVAAFSSVKESVTSYMQNLNTHRSYSELRKIRKSLRDTKKEINGTSLLPGLLSYSTRGEHYTSELAQMIRQNKLQQYDKPSNEKPM
jgi:Bax protein